MVRGTKTYIQTDVEFKLNLVFGLPLIFVEHNGHSTIG